MTVFRLDPDDARTEGLRAASAIFASRKQCGCGHDPEHIIRLDGELSDWLLSRPAHIRVRDPIITAQGNPALRFPARRTGANMATTITDAQIATYPAPEAEDSKGFEVADTITVTTDDTDGAFVAQSTGDDGSTSFSAVAPGSVQVTWSDGTLSFVDTLTVVSGDAAQIVVGAPVVSDQA